jgi:hypothetical protein
MPSIAHAGRFQLIVLLVLDILDALLQIVCTLLGVAHFVGQRVHYVFDAVSGVAQSEGEAKTSVSNCVVMRF